MSVQLPVLSAATYAKFNACVHCGLCLPACPTYVETLDEADSPRGRIHLMKAAVDGRIGISDTVFEHLDRCLVCRACETACPSGVDYHELIEAVRPQVAHAVLGQGKNVRSGMLQWVTKSVLPHPKRAAAALTPLKLARRMGLAGLINRWMPGAGELADSAGVRGDSGPELATFTPALAGQAHRGSVLLLRGCVGSVLSGPVNAACVRVLTRNGFDVHLLPAEPCCGALAAHGNDPQAAHDFAMELVDQLAARQTDHIISPIAGCSAQLKSLHKVLGDSAEYAARARGIVARVRDISEFLMQVGIRPPAGQRTAPADAGSPDDSRIQVRIVTYHDACHLAHGQRITEAPRRILAMIPGIRVVSLAESDLCCGAAGAYSMNQPELARRLGERKVRQVLASGATELFTGNIGCTLQIKRHLRAAGREIPVRHVVELLAEAYEGRV